MNILVFIHSRKHFGAQLVHIPALMAIRKKYPGYNIYAISKFNHTMVLKELGLIDELYIGTGFLFCLKKLSGIRFEIGFSFRPTSHAADWLMLMLGIRKRIGFSKFAGFLNIEKNYTTNRYRAISFFSLVDVPDVNYKLICQSMADQYSDMTSPYQGSVILAPGAGGKEKRWPIERFIFLAEKLSVSWRIVFLVGPEDRGEAEIIRQDGRFKLVESPDMKKLLDMIVNSTLFISNDCGPAHLVHVTYKPLVVLFHTVLDEWFDFRGSSLAIDADGSIENLDQFLVFSHVLKHLNEVVNG